MSKAIIVNSIVEKTGLTKKKGEEVYDAFIEAVQTGLKDDKMISVPGIGNLSVNHRAARTGRNPKTGETLQIEAKNVVSLSVGKKLKELINE